METVILIITTLVVLGALIWICLFIKMAITKDYSFLSGEPAVAKLEQRAGGEAGETIATSIAKLVPKVRLPQPFPTSDLQVEHFSEEPLKGMDERQRAQHAEKLAEMRRRQTS